MAHKNNEQNLIPFNERTEEERRELAKKAGKASGEARRKKKSMREAAKMLLELPIKSKDLRRNLELLGIDSSEATYETAIMVAMMREAMKGNVKAAVFCREMLGEDPRIRIQEEQLRLAKEKFGHEKMLAEKEAGIGENSLADAIQAAYKTRKEKDGE